MSPGHLPVGYCSAAFNCLISLSLFSFQDPLASASFHCSLIFHFFTQARLINWSITSSKDINSVRCFEIYFRWYYIFMVKFFLFYAFSHFSLWRGERDHCKKKQNKTKTSTMAQSPHYDVFPWILHILFLNFG